MNANIISEIMKKYNNGEINKTEASFLLVFSADCDSEAVIAVFKIYSTKEEDK
jgi:hypothetical protein